MMVVNSPFGRYANVVASVVAVLVIVAALSLHLLGRSDQLIDTLAIAAFGVVLGQQVARSEATISAAEKLNGQEARIQALHKRLDEAERSYQAKVAATAAIVAKEVTDNG